MCETGVLCVVDQYKRERRDPQVTHMLSSFLKPLGPLEPNLVGMLI